MLEQKGTVGERKMCQTLEEVEFFDHFQGSEIEMRGFLNTFKSFKGIRSLADCSSS